MLKWPLSLATCVVPSKQKICSLRRTTDPVLDELMAMMTILDELSAGLKTMLIQIASHQSQSPHLNVEKHDVRMGHPRELRWL
jgi:hypothetical protein